MNNQDIVRGTEESCRQKAFGYFEKAKREKSAFFPEASPFEILGMIHKDALGMSKGSRENLEDGHYMRHVGNPKLALQFEAATRIAVYIMEYAQAEMETLRNEEGEPLARVNGTSVIFQQCNEELCTEKTHIPIVSGIVLKNILKEDEPKPEPKKGIVEQMVASLTCLAVQVCSIFLVFEDVIAA